MAETFKSCSFCGKGENRVRSMFSAGSSNICDECVTYCYEMLYGSGVAKAHRKASKNDENDVSSIKLMKPMEIKEFLARDGKEVVRIAYNVRRAGDEILGRYRRAVG